MVNLIDTAVKGAKDMTFSGVGKLAEKAGKLVTGITPEEKQAQKETRSQLAKVTNQLSLTRTIITNNSEVIRELAKSDSRLSNLLTDISNPESLAIQEKIVKGQAVNTKEAALVLDNLQRVTGALESVGVSLDVQLDTVVDKFSNLILDSEQDLESRRQLVAEVADLATKQGVESSALPEIKALMERQLNFTEKETKQVSALLNQLKNDSTGKKMVGTLRDIQEQNETLILTQRELNDALEKQTAGGKTVGDVFRTEGLAKNLRSGLLQSILGAVGLGALVPLLGDFDPLDLLKGGGKLLGKAGGLLSKIPGIGKLKGIGKGMLGKFGTAGKAVVGGTASVVSKAADAAAGLGTGLMSKAGGLIKGGGKLLGKLAVPLAIIVGLMDFFEGFSNAAEIAGLEDGKDLSFLQKTMAGISSLVSGLTFGLMDAKDVFKWLDSGVEFLIGKDGILTKIGDYFKGFIDKAGKTFSNLFKSSKDIFSSLGGGIKDFGKSMLDKIVSGFGTVIDFLFGPSGLISFETLRKVAMFVLSSLPGGGLLLKMLSKGDEEAAKADGKGGKEESLLDKFTGLFSTKPTEITSTGSTMQPKGAEASAKSMQEQTQREKETAKAANQVVQIPIQNANKGSAGTVKRTVVDDYGIHMMNSGLVQ